MFPMALTKLVLQEYNRKIESIIVTCVGHEIVLEGEVYQRVMDTCHRYWLYQASMLPALTPSLLSSLPLCVCICVQLVNQETCGFWLPQCTKSILDDAFYLYKNCSQNMR